MKIKEITACIEKLAPRELQETYDNAGLIIGDAETEVSKALVCIDVTEKVIEEAIADKCNLVISHHPLIFKGLNKINSNSNVGRCVIKAVQNNIAIYAAHTNLDSVIGGVNSKLCEKLGIINTRILKPKSNVLKKLVTFCPTDKADVIRKALFDSGCGHIGNYDSCSYNVDGSGTFCALEGSNPYVGERDKLHHEPETRIETIFPAYLGKTILKALFAAHPYEEVAYDVYPLDNKYNKAGEGMIGELNKAMGTEEFLKHIKSVTNCKIIRHSETKVKSIKNVAVCGGSGSFLIHDAIAAGADMFITADMKYHQFSEAEGRIIIADIGHYESEQFVKEILVDYLNKNFPIFAILVSREDNNSVYYY